MNTFMPNRRFLLTTVTIIFIANVVSPMAAQAEDKLFFASDVHTKYNDLQTLIQKVPACELYGLVGDYNTDGDQSTSTDLKRLTDMMPSGTHHVATQGNHDIEVSGTSTHDSGIISDDWNDNQFYDVYVINYEDFANINDSLDEYFTWYPAWGNDKLIFVMSHFPLHSTYDENEVGNAPEEIFDTLQYWGPMFDIVFVWGHTHPFNQLDDSIQIITKPKETIRDGNNHDNDNWLIQDVVDEELTFTYLNAGYVKPRPEDVAIASYVSLDRNRMYIRRYNKNGSVIQSETVTRCGDGICKDSTGENACNCYADCSRQLNGSCSTASCGGSSSGACWCDSLCEWYNDCCSNKSSVCGCSSE